MNVINNEDDDNIAPLLYQITELQSCYIDIGGPAGAGKTILINK